MNNIQSNTQAASSSSETISASANSLQKKEINKDNESNITAKEASIVAYERGDSLKLSYQEALKLDADHIQELGKTFEELDTEISLLLAVGI